MKKITLIISLLFSLNVFSDWQEETPNGKIMNDVWLNVKGTYIQGIEEFYFYDDCIIGKSNTTYGDLKSGYFVINELTGKIDTFKNEQDWQAFINLHNLEPWIWKRTYSYGWSQLTFGFFLALIAFGVPIFIIYRILKSAINLERFKKPRIIITLIIIGLFVFRYLLDIFPSSI
ncbi:MAG: hypothetical protein K9H61_11750 [Bacteroidia bacterium]|nr:hypothetical protein [Bacteroidia bacterium]MCF8428254.1 hypothetical protein [Bacteroidia bacterium]MCF8447661.1 hypothetical protein [Bacteroidia bacterium]